LRPRLQEGVDVSQVLIRDNFAGVWRHLTGRLAHVARESGEDDGARTQPGCSRSQSALSLQSVALVAPVIGEDLLPVLGISRRSSSGFDLNIAASGFDLNITFLRYQRGRNRQKKQEPHKKFSPLPRLSNNID
jgi:hypothetical protein